jgi:hypothetical protein
MLTVVVVHMYLRTTWTIIVINKELFPFQTYRHPLSLFEDNFRDWLAVSTQYSAGRM